METLRFIELKIGRWLAYADHCIKAAEPLPRCEPFWSFVAFLAAIVCLVVLAGAVVIAVRDKRSRTPAPGGTK